uniref:Uncharacterized protein n=1 Tax=Magallana gigas TaxID=29159 RepID=A0A8W8LC09_MAGGI|nr:uncharacterized protein LOC105340752 [Crassostrea gigas]
MASAVKKMREEDVENYDKRRFCMAILGLCVADAYNTQITLTPLKITNCNAASSGGACFSKAFCDTESFDEGMVLGDVFQTGIKTLKNFAKNGTLPEERRMFLAFDKLLNFLNGEKSIKFNNPQNLHALPETELAVLVANHLMGKLAISSCFLVDKNCTGKRDGCCCGVRSCRMTGEYGDTSIGNLEVWHGHLDMIVNDDLAVGAIENPPDSSGEKSTVEVKANLQRNPKIIAQTIVFSFLQKKRHPEREHFLTPCIGIGNSELIILFYDSEHDVLLESSRVPLFESSVSCKFSYSSILACWLVVNYKIFCSGLVEEFKICKSNFFLHAREKINIYKDELKFQNVNSFQSNEPKLVKVASKVKTSPLMHETEKTILEVLLSLASADAYSNSASGSNSN